MNRLTGLDNNALNRHVIYKYDVLNRRIGQSVNGVVTSYVFDNWNRTEERPTDGRQPRCYLFGGATNIRDGKELAKSEAADKGGGDGGSKGGGSSPGLTAKDIDLGNLANGVPSLGAESQNFVRASRL